MTSSRAVGLIHRHGLRVFTTSDFKTLASLREAAAAVTLARLAADGLLVRIKRGVWANKLAPDLNPYEAVPHLRAPWPAYVSLYSALADYGVVEEIPHAVYAVSPAIPKIYRTALGEFRIHHLPARLMWGYETRQAGQGAYLIADREKAFLDLVYLGLTRRSPLRPPHKRGRSWDLDKKRLTAYAGRFDVPVLEAWLNEHRL